MTLGLIVDGILIRGKGGAAVPYLISQGYTVLETTNGRSGEYGIILGRFG